MKQRSVLLLSVLLLSVALPAGAAIDYDLGLSQPLFHPGDGFDLAREWENLGEVLSVDEYIVLAVAQQYWFWPGWTQQVDLRSGSIGAGEVGGGSVLAFDWPTGAGSMAGLLFYGALVTQGTVDLLALDSVEWGFTDQPASFALTSTAFAEGESIPVQYTCDGTDISPPLAWSGAPTGTAGFALICDDPDAPSGDWVHWVIYRIPPAATGLAEDLPDDDELPDGSRQGRNGWGQNGYRGPCPPSGTHRYCFKLHALDVQLSLAAGATKAELLTAMEGHILAQTELMGTYERF